VVAPATPLAALAELGELKRRTWVTRAGIKVDRMASAWLIRSLIDPEATFRFATADSPPRPGEVRFDMHEGEFTHDGERCTFEVLLDQFGLRSNEALVALAEVVHDLDCKDDRFGRREAPGVALMVDEIVRRTADDAERLAAGTALFDSIYRSFAARRTP
jgi:hypothetical protein